MGACQHCTCDRKPPWDTSEFEQFDGSPRYTFDDDLEREARQTKGLEQNLVVGDSVLLNQGKSKGIIRYFGRTGFSGGIFVGVELDQPCGMNDGSVRGHQYFRCEPNHGIFVRPYAVQKTNEVFSKTRATRELVEAQTREQFCQESSQDIAHPHPHLGKEQFDYGLYMEQSHAQLRAQPGSVSPWQIHDENPHAQQSTPPFEMLSQSQGNEYPYSQTGKQPYEVLHAYGEHANPQTQHRPHEVPSQGHDNDDSGVKGSGFLYNNFY